MPVHAVAEEGFGQEASAYERARPSYPPDAVRWLADHLRIEGGAVVADVAAGTGKLTRLLAPLGARIVAVEPVEGMREAFAQACAGIPLLGATAEDLPVAPGSIDAITVAQAFHWFDGYRALEEFARVLRPGGRLGLIWNARDRSHAWVDAAWSIMDRVEKHAPWRNHDEWRDSAFVEQSWFTPLAEATFEHEQVVTFDDVIERFRSVSHVAALPAEERLAVLDELRALLETHPDTTGREEVALPYRVDAYWCERV